MTKYTHQPSRNVPGGRVILNKDGQPVVILQPALTGDPELFTRQEALVREVTKAGLAALNGEPEANEVNWLNITLDLPSYGEREDLLTEGRAALEAWLKRYGGTCRLHGVEVDAFVEFTKHLPKRS